MELLRLEPTQLGVPGTGIYVIDDAGTGALAGPFETEGQALAWIGQTRVSRRGDANSAPDSTG